MLCSVNKNNVFSCLFNDESLSGCNVVFVNVFDLNEGVISFVKCCVGFTFLFGHTLHRENINKIKVDKSNNTHYRIPIF